MSFYALSTSGSVTSAIDALGRTAFSTNLMGYVQIPAGSYYVKTTGSGGNTQTYTVTVSNQTLGSFTMPHPNPNSPDYDIVTNFFCISSINCPNNYAVQQPKSGTAFPAVSSILLPDRISSYTFQYDPIFGTISKITFPTGGYVRFQYEVLPIAATNYGQFDAVSDIVVTDVYTSTGSGSEDHWSYQLSQGLSTHPTSTVDAPDGSHTTYTGACFVYSIVPTVKRGARPTCKEQSRAVYSSSGQLLKTVAENFGIDGLPTQIATSIYDGLTPIQQLVQNTYDSYDNVVEKDESDYYACSSNPCPDPTTGTLPAPSAGWKRITYTSYAYTTNSALASAHIVNKPSRVLVTDGGGNPVSLTNYTYDNQGNPTYEKRCTSIAGTGSSATCSAAWQTQYTYDTTGQLIQKTEAYGTSKAASTNYTWTGPSGATDSYNGFLTQVTHPNGATDNYTYYSPTGQVKTHTDWNTRLTSYTYDPYFDRIGTITDPQTVDGTTGTTGNGKTTYTYTDTTGAFSVEEQHTITGSTQSSWPDPSFPHRTGYDFCIQEGAEGCRGASTRKRR